MSSAIDVVVVQVTPEMIRNWGWFLAFGVVLLLLGVAAVVRSVRATVVSMVFFGWLLVFAGLIEFVDAFMVGQWAGFFLHMLAAILFGITGFLMVARPVISAEAVTFLMSLFFLLAGLLSIDRCVLVSSAGLGLAGPERNHRSNHGLPPPGAMACLRPLGDRTFRWN